MNKFYEDYIKEKVHEQLIKMAKRMLADDILSLEKIAEYSGLELAEIWELIDENVLLQYQAKNELEII